MNKQTIIAMAVIGTLSILSSLAFSRVKKSTTTDWVGSPMVSDNDRWHPSQSWLPTIEMGLRSDGVVVWREREKAK